MMVLNAYKMIHNGHQDGPLETFVPYHIEYEMGN